MSDAVPDPSPSTPGTRIGHAERESAVTALKRHHEAGRLDDEEYRERSDRALAARAQHELDALFTDLPASSPGHTPPAGPITATPEPVAAPGIPDTTDRSVLKLPEPYATTVVSITPILAVILFFVTGTWLWFLAIPIVALLVYGPEGRPDTGPEAARKRQRDKGRKRDRD
ncbi:DUF1707 domain-containing protein [Kineosporia sp. J2-2]|uniref:DUF1707 domain-containing protein n=1 Tax=Kineosporia corallincola TaxID=2835133 RepID=A0ABS5TFY8_9ACTN|nr:DUF1707 domain-containing protein [Kineosporia corallincola]MBT0769319.1 DUF1707 domain-containing protein [Kineosporia corallincola]